MMDRSAVSNTHIKVFQGFTSFWGASQLYLLFTLIIIDKSLIQHI